MQKLDPVLLEEAVRRIVAALRPEMIYLYGSHAYGQPHRDSDVDLLKVHSLTYLLDLCEVQEPGFASLRDRAEVLAPYAVAIRYPGGMSVISPTEAVEGSAQCLQP